MSNEYIVVNTKKNTSDVWSTISSSYVPSKGEVCIIVPNYNIFNYERQDDGSLKDDFESTATVGVRIGNGEDAFIDLPLLGDISSIKPDWNETDTSSPNYIWHKPMVNSDMFDVSAVKVLKISNENLREAIVSPTKEFHKEPYCLIKKLNVETEFIHPEDLMIEDDRTWGHYEFDFSADGKNKTPKYFYRNNIISQIETKNIEENDLTYKYKIKSLLDDIILSSLKDNSNFVNLFNIAEEIINPDNTGIDYSEGLIYIGINNNYYEYYQGKLINLGNRYYAHVSVLSDIWDATNDITEKFYINKEITIDEIKEILKEQLNKENKEESLLQALSESIYNKIYNNNGSININLIRQYIQQDIYHYYEINDELILDYSTNELYLKKNRLQHYLNVADGKSLVNVELNSENYNTEENCFKVEINNDFNFTEKDDLQDKINIEVIDQSRTQIFSITSLTNTLTGIDIIPNKTKVYIQTPFKKTELEEAESFAYDSDEDTITKLQSIEGYNFSEKGLVKIFKKEKEDNILSENVSLGEEDTNLIGAVKNSLKERLKNNLNDVSYFSAVIEEKEEQEDNSTVIIHNVFNVNFNINYNDNGSIDKIIFDDKTEENINNIKENNILSLTTSFIYPEEKLNYTLIKDENYLALDKDNFLKKTDKIYYKQDEFSSLALPIEGSYYTYEYNKENGGTIIFNRELEVNTQVSLFFNPIGNFSPTENVNLSLSEDNKKIIIKIYNLDSSIQWKVGLIFGKYFNSNLSLSIFYQTRRIKDYLLSNRRVNWNVNNPTSINYVLNRPIFQRDDKKIAMLEKDGSIYTNGEEDYYNFFVKLILSIAGEPNTGLEDRISALEQWRKNEIDPYVIKLKTYQYKGDANKVDFNEELTIGSDNIILNNHSLNDTNNESLEIWNEQYNKVGTMKALNDLADYCAALKKKLDSINGSLIHIGTKDPDSEGKTACKVWLNTNKDNGNGVFYYRTIATSELPPLNTENYTNLLKAAQLWIPVSAIWSAKIDETVDEEIESDNSSNKYVVLGSLNIGETVKIGGMTFRVIQKGMPNTLNKIDSRYLSVGRTAGTQTPGDPLYAYYNNNVQQGIFLIWDPENGDTSEANEIWSVDGKTYYDNILIPKVPSLNTGLNDYFSYINDITSSLNILEYQLQSKYGKEIFFNQVRVEDMDEFNNYQGKIYLPTSFQLNLNSSSNYQWYEQEFPNQFSALEYFKENKPKFVSNKIYPTAMTRVVVNSNGEKVNWNSITSGETIEVMLRPMIILDAYKTRLDIIDGQYYIKEEA